jgi:hypothetical protein
MHLSQIDRYGATSNNGGAFLSRLCRTASIIEWTDMVAASFVFFLVDPISNGRAFIISTLRHVPLLILSLTL